MPLSLPSAFRLHTVAGKVKFKSKKKKQKKTPKLSISQPLSSIS